MRNYKDRLVFLLMSKLSLYFRPKWCTPARIPVGSESKPPPYLIPWHTYTTAAGVTILFSSVGEKKKNNVCVWHGTLLCHKVRKKTKKSTTIRSASEGLHGYHFYGVTAKAHGGRDSFIVRGKAAYVSHGCAGVRTCSTCFACTYIYRVHTDIPGMIDRRNVRSVGGLVVQAKSAP